MPWRGQPDPHAGNVKVLQPPPLPGTESARPLVQVLLVEDHPVNQQRRKDGKRPANILLPRGGGVAPNLEPFHLRYGIWENEPIEVLDRRDGLAADRDD